MVVRLAENAMEVAFAWMVSWVSVVLKMLCVSAGTERRVLYFVQYGWKRPWQWVVAQLLTALIDPRRVPSHVAVVMDGNRRFAHSIGLQSVKEGHEEGARKLKEFVDWCLRFEAIREVTVWALSTDNLTGRSPREIQDLWDLCEEHLPQFSARNQASLKDRGVSVRVIGERQLLPDRIRDIVLDLEARTQLSSPRLVLNVALPYGGRQEIVAAAKAGGPDGISANVYTLSDPDLIIRSGGECRLSGFMLWQSAHAELYFSSRLWPCFMLSHFLTALYTFQQRQRRFGR